MYIYTYRYIIFINENVAVILKKSKKEEVGGLEVKNGRGMM